MIWSRALKDSDNQKKSHGRDFSLPRLFYIIIRLHLWLRKNANEGLVLSADRAYRETPVFGNLTELGDNLFSTLKWAVSLFRAYPPWLQCFMSTSQM